MAVLPNALADVTSEQFFAQVHNDITQLEALIVWCTDRATMYAQFNENMLGGAPLNLSAGQIAYFEAVCQQGFGKLRDAAAGLQVNTGGVDPLVPEIHALRGMW